MTSQNSCCVNGCTTQVSCGIPLHYFPNPSMDGDRFRLWKTRVGTNFDDMDDHYISKNRRVCHRHFEDRYHGSKNRLVKSALPTLHLPVIPQSSSAHDPALPMDVDPVAPNAELMDVDRPVTHDCYNKGNISEHDANINKPTQNRQPRFVTSNERQLLKAVSRLKSKLKKMGEEKMSYKKRLAAAEKISLSKAFEVLSKKMTKAAKRLLEIQLTQSNKKRSGRRFTLEQKVLALSIYKPSPKAYRLLSQLCILPKPRTLQRMLAQVPLKPGINESTFEELEKKVKKMPRSHQYCTLIFDEMAIAASVNLDQKRDLINGLIDDGENRTNQFCDHALVFMVRGVIKKYKQPIAYVFCQGSTPTTQLKRLIKECTKRLQETGLKVVATVCDQGTTNVAAINGLLNETKEKYIRRNEEYRGGFFEIGDQKIFPIFDPPHLMKGVRNNLLTKDLEYTMNNKKGVAKWEDIQRLYRRAPGYKGVRMVRKLTAQHVEPAMIPKMKVKNCTQVFSRTVAVALGFLANKGVLPQRSVQTADILLFFDDLFDSVNGSFSDMKSGKILRRAVTPRSPHHALWRASLQTLKSMKYIAKNNIRASVPSLSSWIKTIEAFQSIVNHFHKLGYRSILLRHFNQDPLENFFGAIRSHGFGNIMPNAQAFESAYKTLLINNMTSAHSVGANCEADGTDPLHNLEMFFEEKCVAPTAESVIFEEDLQIVPTDMDALLKSQDRGNIEKCAAVGHCSGWLLKKARTIFKTCRICEETLESTDIEAFHELIKLSEYKKDEKWLVYPRKEFFEMFLQIENIVQTILDKRCHIKDLTNYLNLIVTISVQVNFIKCDIHKKDLCDFLIRKSVLFFVHNWCNEINNILQKKDNIIIREHNEASAMKIAARNYILLKTGRRFRQTGTSLAV